MNNKKFFLIPYIIFAVVALCYVIHAIATGGNSSGVAPSLMLFAVISVSLYRRYKTKD